MINHAIVTIGDYEIPLIGIPIDETEMECDCCHEIRAPITWVEISEDGKHFYCKKCGQKQKM